MRHLALLSLLLAACTPAPERCLRKAERNLATVDALIAGTEDALAQGYAVETVVHTRSRWRACDRIGPGGQPAPRDPARLCLEDETRSRTVTRAIDPVVERRKLAHLKEARAAALTETAACRALNVPGR